MSEEVCNGTFEYLRWFPEGNRAHLLKPKNESEKGSHPALKVCRIETLRAEIISATHYNSNTANSHAKTRSIRYAVA